MIQYLFDFDDWIVGAAIVCLYLISAMLRVVQLCGLRFARG